MGNKIVIPLPNGYQLIAERNTDPNFLESGDIFIGITDGEGVWYQDLAIVRRAYETHPRLGRTCWKDDEFEVFVYSDKDSNDYTHRYKIGLYHGGI